MRILLDTHLLLWTAGNPDRLPADARALIEDADNVLCFSAASLWEIAIKSSLGRSDFQVDPTRLRQGLIENGFAEMPINGEHAAAVATLPFHRKDPFDRMLYAQAMIERVTLPTSDAMLAHYGDPVRAV